MGGKVFAFPVFSLQLSNFQGLWPVNSVMNWPENIPRVKPTDNDNTPHFAIASYHLSDQDPFILLLPPTVPRKSQRGRCNL